MDAKKWLQDNHPTMRRMDMTWTAARYDFPEYVKEYIRDNWTRIDERNGGTYEQ